MNRNSIGQFKSKALGVIGFIKLSVFTVFDYSKKTVITLTLLSAVYGFNQLDTLIPKQNEIYVAAAATTTKPVSVMGNNFDQFNSKLNIFKEQLVQEALKDPQTTFECRKAVEEKVNKKINILTATTF